LDDLWNRLSNGALKVTARKEDLFRMKWEHLLLLHPRRMIHENTDRLIQLRKELASTLRATLNLLRQKTEGIIGKLGSLSPLSVLERGYSISRLLPSQRIIRRASELRLEDRVQVKVHQGSFTAQVKDIQE